MSEPNVTLPEGIERAVMAAHERKCLCCPIKCHGLECDRLSDEHPVVDPDCLAIRATLRREIAAAMEERDMHTYSLSGNMEMARQASARARAIREGK